MEYQGLAGAALLAAPFALLLAAIWWAARGYRKPPPPVLPREVATGRYGVPVVDRRAAAAAAAAATPAAKARPAPPPAMSLDDILAGIAAAEGSGNETKLAGLYVLLARHQVATERGDEAAEVLRKSIRISARLGLRPEHAAARLELGDLARAAGDLTTACEHWQIARGLYFDLKLAGELETAETRMSRNGCPTDWVLNDF